HHRRSLRHLLHRTRELSRRGADPYGGRAHVPRGRARRRLPRGHHDGRGDRRPLLPCPLPGGDRQRRVRTAGRAPVSRCARAPQPGARLRGRHDPARVGRAGRPRAGTLGRGRLWAPARPGGPYAAGAGGGGPTLDRGNARPRRRSPGDPTFVLEADGERIAALWVAGQRVVVRRAPAEDAPVVGEIDPAWDAGAIRLVIRAADGSSLRTDPFARKVADTGPDALTRASQTVIDVRGTYQAALRDAKGAPVGWLRVRVGPYLPAPRIFEGVVPAAVDPALSAAAAVALDAEIDWIEAHALDVYRGDGGGGLERSIPARP